MEESQPIFNSSLQYLWQVNNLIWSAHTASIDTTTVSDEFMILSQLDVSLDPRMNSAERWEAEVLRKRAKSLNSERIRDYFIFLNRLAHAKGLILKDTETLPQVLRNTI